MRISLTKGVVGDAAQNNNKRITVPGVGPELGIGHVLGNHYKGSGACYYQMGESMGKAMLEMTR